jgi:cystathionine gamma-synthase
LIVKEKDFSLAWKGWQHIGEIVSSRQAEAALMDAPLPEKTLEEGKKAESILRERIAAGYCGVNADDVFLFSSGMAAIAAIHRVVIKLNPKQPTIQLEFPYLDALKVQEKCNPAGAVNFSNTTNGGLDEINAFFHQGNRAAALFTEVPSNPLLKTADIESIAPILQRQGVPLIIDDTVATCLNVNTIEFADAITTSLTKSFSGEGDVAAGSVVLNSQSPFYERFKAEMPSEEAASPLFCLDAVTLEINSRHFRERVMAMNENASEIIHFLSQHPKVEKLWHPSIGSTAYYDRVKTAAGGYGALFSMTLKGGEPQASQFYDQLRISKGPSLGTNFSLACPYTLLAHYTELDWAQRCGVPRDLIRFWIGLEEPDDLLDRFAEALQ